MEYDAPILTSAQALERACNKCVGVDGHPRVVAVDRDNFCASELVDTYVQAGSSILCSFINNIRKNYRGELALEVARKGILPGLNLILELGSRDSESLGGDVDRLEAVVTGEENQRSGQVVDKERCVSKRVSVPEGLP